MATTAQNCWRLAGALEELAAAEAVAVRAGDFAMVAEIQGRAGPVVEYLAQHGPAVADRALRARIEAVVGRRAETVEHLGVQIAEAKSEINRTTSSQIRAARIAPVYGSGGNVGARQLRAVG